MGQGMIAGMKAQAWGAQDQAAGRP